MEETGDSQHDNTLQGGLAPNLNPELLGSKSIFHSFKPDGGLRDVLTIECQKMNGEDFKGTISYTEATVKIFQQELGFSIDIIHSVKMSFNKFRMVSFKLKKQVNIDELADKENFEMKRSYIVRSDVLTDLPF